MLALFDEKFCIFHGVSSRPLDIILREVGCKGAKVTTALAKERIEQVDEAEHDAGVISG